jgi:Fic family protein
MSQPIHTFLFELTMKLAQQISDVDRFSGNWSQTEIREGQTLKQLKAIATISSIGASTRIEGSKMTDKEVEVLIEKLAVSKLEERDEQEVAGYYEALDTIAESYKNIEITEGSLKNLHKILMSRSEKDEWHRGDYKRTSNAVEANHPDGTKQLIFKTTVPGLETEEAMRKLVEWYHTDNDTLPLIKSAVFIYDFLSIHPFQDGNGRLSRLLGTLLLLRDGYSWIQYISFEHEIEKRKDDYYKVLMQTQKQRPGEKIDEWVSFFLDCLLNLQKKLEDKLSTTAHSITQVAPREKNILAYIENHPGSKSSEISAKLNIPLSTVKKMLTAMVEHKTVIKYGMGAGTNYMVEKKSPLKTALMFRLTDANRKKEFLLMNTRSFLEIKRIQLNPLFEWIKPDDWYIRLSNQGLSFKITVYHKRGDQLFFRPYILSTFVNVFQFHPVFLLHTPINIPFNILDKNPNLNEYPITVEIELISSAPKFDFDVLFIYDEM